jgi:hypothetical protein
VISDKSVEGNVTICASSESDVYYAQEGINEMIKRTRIMTFSDCAFILLGLEIGY